MSYIFRKDDYYQETEKIYGQYPTDVSDMENVLNGMEDAEPSASPYRKKVWIYQVAEKYADVKIFPSCPFYGEIDTGRERNSVTSSFPPQPGIGCWLMKQYPEFVSQYAEWSGYYTREGVMNGPQFMDASHHYADCETVLKYGLSGIKEKAAERKKDKALTETQVDFLDCIEEVCKSLINISDRFASKAKEMQRAEKDNMRREVLGRIAGTASRVPKNPAETFYEAMCAIWFTREMCNALDGLGFAVIGHMDRILMPYYEKDIMSGNISSEEAQELMDCFVSMTDARWDLEAELPGGTNADIVIGGCDREGRIVYNEVTKMILNSYKKYHFANPKLQARITKNPPEDYLRRLGEIAGMGLNVLSIFNDDVIIRANQRWGKSIEDCRMYVAGGCQEICVGREVNCRAYVYLNLVQMLNASLYPEYWNQVFKRDGLEFLPAHREETFEGFYAAVMENYRNELLMFMAKYNGFGMWWKTINPSLLFSATMISCIEKAMDVSEGGAVYNTDNFAATGTGTVIDALYAIKTAVYDRNIVTMDELRKAMEHNFDNHEVLRQYLLHKVPKFGRDKEVNVFGRKVMHDLAERLGGQDNYRQGKFEPSLFAFYSYDWFKEFTQATADGRKRGTGLSRGVNPGESTENIDIATLIDSIKELDFTEFPGGAVNYMDIPVTYKDTRSELFAAVIQGFCESGGSVMDFNVVNKELLLKAQKEPEAHRNIVVRVCGYSAYFHTLSREMQNEVIGRTQR